MSSDQEAFRRLVLESRYLEETMNELQSRLGMMNSAITELRLSNVTLEGLENQKKGSQLFVPVGGGSYVKAKLETSKQVIVGIGADVAVEKSLQDAKAEVETRLASMEQTHKALGEQLNQVVAKLQQNQSKMQQMSAKLQEG
ncbi:MAG: prefoldin subunit alpha [Candidatus Bathyarchaeota archaeon]